MTPETPFPSSPDVDLGAGQPSGDSHSGSTPNPRARRRYWMRWMTALILILAIGVTGAALRGRPQQTTIHGGQSDDPDEVAETNRLSIKTIKARRDPSVQVQVKQIVSVEPFYQAELRAQVTGVVRAVHKDINDSVVKGEVLIEINVPDLDRDVTQRTIAIKQRRQELRVSLAKLKVAEAGREVAETVIRQRQAEVLTAEATSDFRRKRLARIRDLAAKGTIGPDVVEEWERDTEASEAAVLAAKVGVDRAKADLKEAGSKIEGAAADIDLKEATVEAAIDDMEKARAIAGFAHITAPFDGVITKRNIDPGSFVQNASTGQSEPLMTVSRVDLVTVVAKFPDNVAPLVTRDTPAFIEIDEVPGLHIAARVTRFSPSIQNSDRTMKVEVDLFNEGEEAHQKLVDKAVSAGLGALGSRTPIELAFLRAASRQATEGFRKGPDDPVPPRAVSLNLDAPAYRLLPGETGTMRLMLGHFDHTYVLPSSAVYSRGGKAYILLVREGVTKQVPVQVQVNDGKVAKVSLLMRRNAGGRSREVMQELTGKEEIVPTRQMEIGDGQPVKTTLSDW